VDWPAAALRWYGLLAALTWAFAPAVAWLCRALSDRGVTLARPVALLGAIYPAWLLASLGALPFGATPMLLTALAAGAVGWGPSARRHGLDRVWLRGLLAAEAASLACFLAYLWLRGFTPAILHTEKPMDFAFLASSARAVVMPPPDPWFVGEPINYYYLGYLIHGAAARIAGAPPEVAFNLALATVVSTSAVAAFGVTWNVLRPRLSPPLSAAGGLLAAFFLVLAGNLYTPLQLLRAPRPTWNADWWDGAVGVGWRSSRIVCDGARIAGECRFPAVETINEFPFFSILLGDLHPHLMALPYTLVALGLAWNLARGFAASPAAGGWPLRVVATGATVGALYPLNAWDYPTFLLLVAVAIWFGVDRSLARAAQPLILLAVASMLAWLPFWLAYQTPIQPVAAGAIGRVPLVSTLLSAVSFHTGERTSLAEYLTIFGVPYLFGVVFVFAGLRQMGNDATDALRRWAPLALVAALVPAVLLSAPVIAVCGIPLLLAARELARPRSDGARTAALVLFAAAWILSIGVELVYIRDAFDSRMNTLFKFYYQTWTLYALAAALAVPLLWAAIPRPAWPRAALAGATALAILAGLAYPLVASTQWTDRFSTWQGLDGLAFAEASAPDEVAAIRWLRDAAAPGDVILEAAGCSYYPFNRLPFNRVAAFTGLPTVIGWDGHERQWRAGQPALLDQIPQRQRDVASIYANPQSPLRDAYGIDWLVVGDYEANNWQSDCPTVGPYPGVSSPGFPGPGWEEAFRSGDTRIYRRVAE
jgi:YYY domain-containing protein